jgi:hypothetical protein
MAPTLPPSTKPAPKLGFLLRRGAMAQKVRSLVIALVLATPMVLQLELPAQANFRQTLRGIFTGDTGQGARGNARGAAIRDRRCGAEAPSNGIGQEGVAIAASASPADPSDQLTLLVPNTGQTLSTTTLPDVFVYIPSHTSGAVEQAFQVSPAVLFPAVLSPKAFTPEPAINSSQTKIDLEDIDSVIDEKLQENVEQYQQSELLLEFQFGDTIRHYSLPDEALIAKIQLPDGSAFEIGDTLPLEVRLVCRRVDLTTLSQAATTEISYSAESEVFVNVQRVAASRALLTALETHQSDDRHQLYLDNGLWFEMVSALAANPGSDEWAALLEELAIPVINPTPHTLIPATGID